jgi:hypothetical protein
MILPTCFHNAPWRANAIALHVLIAMRGGRKP